MLTSRVQLLSLQRNFLLKQAESVFYTILKASKGKFSSVHIHKMNLSSNQEYVMVTS